MVKLIKDEIKDNYRILEYDNGVFIKELISKGSDQSKEVTIPPSPIEMLKKQVSALGMELSKSKIETVKKDKVINELGKQVAQLKIQVNGGDK